MRFGSLYTCCSNLRQGSLRQLSLSPDQARACFWVPSSLTSDSCLFLPGHRPHVSISSGFPKGVGFLGNPTRHSHTGGSLLIRSTTDESCMSSSSVPTIPFAFW